MDRTTDLLDEMRKLTKNFERGILERDEYLERFNRAADQLKELAAKESEEY